MYIVDKLRSLGYEFQPVKLEVLAFHNAVRTGNLVFTSGQLPVLGDRAIRGKVGGEIDVAAAREAAEICAFNAIRAIGAVADISSVVRVVKVLGLVNVADGFHDTSSVLNGATDFLNAVFGAENTHARTAIGVVVPNNWAVELELVAELRAG